MPNEDERLPEWVQRWWRDAYHSPLAVSHAKVEEAINVVYGVLDAPPPPIVWVASPAAQIIPSGVGTSLQRVAFERDFAQQAVVYHQKLASRIEHKSDSGRGWRSNNSFSERLNLVEADTRFLDMYMLALRETIQDYRSNPIYAQGLSYLLGDQWIGSKISLISEGFSSSDEVNGALGRALATLMETTFFTVFSAPCLVCERPTLVPRLDGQRFRLDNPIGPAILFPDGFAKFYLQGLEFDAQVVLHPERMDTQTIFDEVNQERRRIKLDRFGYEKFITEVDASTIDNSKYGTLYRVAFDRGDDLQMIQVTNTTPEPDGIYRKFFLRVPPWVTSAKAAVAWTFDLEESEYEPEFES